LLLDLVILLTDLIIQKLDINNTLNVYFLNHLDDFLTNNYNNVHLSRFRSKLIKKARKQSFGKRMIRLYVFAEQAKNLQKRFIKKRKIHYIKQEMFLANFLKTHLTRFSKHILILPSFYDKETVTFTSRGS